MPGLTRPGAANPSALCARADTARTRGAATAAPRSPPPLSLPSPAHPPRCCCCSLSCCSRSCCWVSRVPIPEPNVGRAVEAARSRRSRTLSTLRLLPMRPGPSASRKRRACRLSKFGVLKVCARAWRRSWASGSGSGSGFHTGTGGGSFGLCCGAGACGQKGWAGPSAGSHLRRGPLCDSSDGASDSSGGVLRAPMHGSRGVTPMLRSKQLLGSPQCQTQKQTLFSPPTLSPAS
eukprot:365592-Chlamydomonas_euryale.AAC.8